VKRDERGFTLTELLIVMTIVGVLAAIAGTHTMRARAAAYQASAVASMREINSGQASYAAVCGSGGYAIDLADLARPPSPGGIAFVSAELGSNGARKSGYVFALVRSRATGTTDVTSATCNGSIATRATGYQASGNPDDDSVSQFVATNSGGTIYMNAVAIANPIPPGTAGLPQ
jgi:prepilin-type N-terminal cleavage/methylation domain-containing protein